MLKENEIAIGQIVSAHALKGEINMVTLTDFPKRFDKGNEIKVRISDKECKTLKITGSRASGPNFTLKIEGIDTRTSAEALRGSYAFVYDDEVFDLDEEYTYVFKLIGMEVYTDKGELIGKITDVLQGGANDVYVIDKKICIPAIKDCILDVNEAENKMTIFPMPGLF